MCASLLAAIPGSVIFQALRDGEPMAFVFVGATLIFAVGYYFFHRFTRS